MKTPVVILFFFCLIIQIHSQKIELILVPFEKNNKWGYLDINDSIIVDAIFEEAYPTFDFRGKIKLNGKYGFINEKGEIVIKPQYDTAEDFKYGITKVSKRGKVRYINTQGRKNKQTIAICGGGARYCMKPRPFTEIDTFKVGSKYGVVIYKGLLENKKLIYIPDTLQTFFDKIESIGRHHIALTKGKKKAILMDYKGYKSLEYFNSILDFKYDEFMFFPCRGIDSDRHVIFGFKENGKWGYIKLYGGPNEIISAKYLSITSLERGIALVEYEKGKYGFINHYGKEYFIRKN